MVLFLRIEVVTLGPDSHKTAQGSAHILAVKEFDSDNRIDGLLSHKCHYLRDKS